MRNVFHFLLAACLLLPISCSRTGSRMLCPSLPAPVSGISRLRNYEIRRSCSGKKVNNADYVAVPSKKSRIIADLEGPGEITHIWMTISTPDSNHLRNLVLRIYWDGNPFPSVETPLGDFFGLGHARYYNYNSAFQAIGTNHGLNSFWPMPFSKSARVVIENQGPERIKCLYYYVDWRKFKHKPRNLGYFHAQYRQAMPCPDGSPYLFLHTGGAPGHFVGVNLSIHTQTSGWWGEGDDIFTIDGGLVPTLWGSGSEDYFCGAWCYGDTFYNDYFGMPLREKHDQSMDNYWNVYRYHVENPVTFRNSLKLEMEHGSSGGNNTRKNGRNNDYSSVAYWYMKRPVPLVGELPPAEERLPKLRHFVFSEEILEADLFQCDPPENVKLVPQGMASFEKDDFEWYKRDQLFCKTNEEGTLVRLSFELEKDLEGEAVIAATRAPDYGTIDISLDGLKVVADFNGYADDVKPVLIPIGHINLKAGTHEIEVFTKAKDERSSGFRWGLDYLRVGGTPPPTEENLEQVP